MRRRTFIAGLGSAVAWPVMARAQQRPTPVVGFLSAGSLATNRDIVASFRKGLAETGYVEGRNVVIEYRWAEEHEDRLPQLAADLVYRQMATIATPSTTAAARTATAATQGIPIVFLTGSDPVEAGLVASLNRPGRNATGVAILSGELAAKRLELLHELVPTAALIAYLVNPTNPVFADSESKPAHVAAHALGVRLLTMNASTPDDIETAFASLVQGARLVGGDAFFEVSQRDQIVALAARRRIPAIYDRREGAAAGGLTSYGCRGRKPPSRRLHRPHPQR